jgi:hypothetical protein
MARGQFPGFKVSCEVPGRVVTVEKAKIHVTTFDDGRHFDFAFGYLFDSENTHNSSVAGLHK